MTENKKPRPNPVDKFVGEKLKQLRTMKGFTQEKLAQSVGITFQQIQKYERGTNRIGASRLFDFSKVLKVPVGSFFDGANRAIETAFADDENAKFSIAEAAASTFDADPFNNKETLDLVRAYYQIPDPQMRKKVVELAKLLAQTEAA